VAELRAERTGDVEQVAGAGLHLVAEALDGPQTEMTWLYSDIASTGAEQRTCGTDAGGTAPQRGENMKAIVQDTYGSTDVLELRDIDKPEIANDEVLVRVHAAGVDRGVWHVMTGLPYPIRLAGYGLRAPKTPVLGADVAGVVEAVGNSVPWVPTTSSTTRVRTSRRGSSATT
jgi:hypothetical protein